MAMVAFHFCFDLAYFRVIARRFLPRRVLAARAHRDPVVVPAARRREPRAGAAHGAAAAQASGGTSRGSPRARSRSASAASSCSRASYIWFGVLHAIAVSLVLIRPLADQPQLALALGIVVIVAGQPARVARGSTGSAWGWLGFATMKPRTEDYVPLFPWAGVMLVGVALGHALVRNQFRTVAAFARAPRRRRLARPPQPRRLHAPPAAALRRAVARLRPLTPLPMRRFADLYCALDASTKTNAKVAALVAYFRAAPPADAAWATYFLTGRKLKRAVGSRDLRDAALALAQIPEWLFDASYDAVGDLAETIALVLPAPEATDARGLAEWVDGELAPLAGLPSPDVQARLAAAWHEARPRRAVRVHQARHRRVSRRRRKAARAARPGGSVRGAGRRRRAAPRRRLAARRRVPRRRAGARTRHRPPSRIGRIPSCSRIRWTASRSRSGPSPTGRRSGNGTASARSS